MQSSYKIIKGTVIGDSALVSPPILDKLYEKMADNKSESKDNNLSNIYDALTAEANAKVNEIINKAKEEAQLIVESAYREAEEIKNRSGEEGYQEGYRQGYQEGYEFGLSEANLEGQKIKFRAESIKAEAEEYLKNCHEESRKYIKECEKEIIKLSVDIARQIINTELTVNPEAIYKIAEKLISRTTDKKQIILKANPRDFNILKNRKDELSIYVEDSSNIIIVADSGISHGSVRAETSSGFIDGDIETQLNIVLNKILEV